jgi:hypothetical protein
MTVYLICKNCGYKITLREGIFDNKMNGECECGHKYDFKHAVINIRSINGEKTLA